MSSYARPGSDPYQRGSAGAAPGTDSDGGYGVSYDGSYGQQGGYGQQRYYGDTGYADSRYAETAYADGSYADPAYRDVSYAERAFPGPAYTDPGPGSADTRFADAAFPGSGFSDSGFSDSGFIDSAYGDYAAPAAPRPRTEAPRSGGRVAARAAARARARRRRRVRNGFLGVGSVAAVAVIAMAGLVHPNTAKTATAAIAQTSAPVTTSQRSNPADTSRSTDRATPAAALAQLPGLGASFRKQIPADAQQVLLVSGTGKNANTGTATLYTRTADGSWLAGTAWPSHNALDGWTTHHMEGDLHSPIGVYSLTDAGGLDANPGTKLPYTHSSAFKALGTGFEGESLADAFDYVVAINYNHVAGSSPLSAARPLGANRGGGIWVHVDHGGPTHGCVSLAKADMAILLKDLDPSKHPVIVMGDAASLAA
ncbi:L,D-peptidoglycan transpeptidase YkuD (ErfK/YbiS/YcfS/YnhG family) [Streptomyces sp. 846.5]|nr:L,D-peptidoglycan transpeptidase YkuD (ErfK/YbiS/YcfS/YnhG family) [Streptomyces sp. 846.5]